MMNKELFDLKDREWKEFKVKNVFSIIQRGKRLTKANQIPGKTPYISSSATNNGVDNYISNKKNVRIFSNCMTLANSGSIGNCFYQPFEFVASDHVTKLANDNFNKYIYLFIGSILNRLSEKYSFNREINNIRLKKEKIILPVDDNDNPDWEFMESYMKNREEFFLRKYERYLKKIIQINKTKESELIELSSKKWIDFFISDIGEIESGKDIYGSERVIGDIPYISAKSKDNGIGHFVENENDTLEDNCISVNRNGSVGYAFYHPYKALYSNDCRKIRLNKNKYISLFIANQISSQRSKYSYGYKMGTGRLKRQKIMLPVDDNDNPDWEFMESYMKQLEYKKISEYLDYIENRIN